MSLRIRGAGLLVESPLPDRRQHPAPQVRRKMIRQIAALPFQVYGLHSWRFGANEGCICSQLVFCCLMGGLAGVGRANTLPSKHGGERGQTHSPKAILETAEDAAYRSLRSEKNHSLSGDSDLHARSESEQLCVCGVRNVNATAASSGWNLASFGSKHDCVMLRGSAPRTPKSKARERRWVREVGRVSRNGTLVRRELCRSQVDGAV